MSSREAATRIAPATTGEAANHNWRVLALRSGFETVKGDTRNADIVSGNDTLERMTSQITHFCNGCISLPSQSQRLQRPLLDAFAGLPGLTW